MHPVAAAATKLACFPEPPRPREVYRLPPVSVYRYRYCTGKMTRGEPGHTRDTRAHTGTRITQTNLTTNIPCNPQNPPERTRTTARRPNRLFAADSTAAAPVAGTMPVRRNRGSRSHLMEKTRLEDQHRLRPYKDRTQGEPGALGHHARSRAGSYLTESVAPPPPPGRAPRSSGVRVTI